MEVYLLVQHPVQDLYDGLYYVLEVTHVVIYLEKHHERHLRFHRVVVVQNMINDPRYYRYCKRECLDQVHNKITKNKTTRILMERKQSKEIVF